jgi:tetratricopeptide (TPR) repeat protein
LISDIDYHEKRYLKGIETANKSVKLAKDMGTRDLHAEALMMKAKNGVKQGILSKVDAIKILDEAKTIAEEIGCPEVLWKIYFAYGRILQNNKEYLQALKYYRKCNEIFEDVISKIKKESYRKSYLNRPDRKLVATAVDEIERLLD